MKQTRKALQEKGKKGTQEEIAEVLGMSQNWVSKYDENPTEKHSSCEKENLSRHDKSEDSTNQQKLEESGGSETEEKSKKTEEKVAKQVGFGSGRTYQRAKKVWEKVEK